MKRITRPVFYLIGNELWEQWWNQASPAWADALLGITPRGFTGHEHLDRHGLIHMNGRVYDPALGRFLQADPFIEDTGTLNRYTYLLNNPLSYSDPSGYFSFKDFARLALSFTVSYFTQTWALDLLGGGNVLGAIGVAAAGGGAAGGVTTGTWDGALAGAFTAVTALGIGAQLDAKAFEGDFYGGLNKAGVAYKVSAHGVVGGVVAEVQGGRFGHGFLSSGISAGFSPAVHNPQGNEFLQMATAAIIGGTVSEISGGKFANGATTAALQFAFNQAQESLSGEARIERRIGTAKEGIEITDDDALMIFEELGFGEQQIAALSDMRPIAKSKGVEDMIHRLRIIICIVSSLFLSGSLLGKESFPGHRGSGSELQTEWLNWCNHVRSELEEQKIYETKAAFVTAEIDAEDVQFIDFESLRVPYFIDEPFTISIRRGLNGAAQLRIAYESSLSIFVAPMLRNPIDSIFDKIVPELPGAVENYIVETYESKEGFTTQVFDGVPDLAQLRLEGYNFTIDDIDCGGNIEEVLRRVAVTIASVSADYAAIIAGQDVAYWSSNSFPGVVIRQEVPVSRGSLGPRILWSGEFFGDDEFWQVVVSFDVEDQDRYDRLGALLANPATE